MAKYIIACKNDPTWWEGIEGNPIALQKLPGHDSAEIRIDDPEQFARKVNGKIVYYKDKECILEESDMGTRNYL